MRCIERLVGGVIVGSSCCVGIKAAVASYHHFVNWLYTSVRLCCATVMRCTSGHGTRKEMSNGAQMGIWKQCWCIRIHTYHASIDTKKTFTLPFSHCLSLSHITHTYTKDTHTYTHTWAHTPTPLFGMYHCMTHGYTDLRTDTDTHHITTLI